MDEKRIEEIVRKVFEEAKLGCVSHKKSALSKYVADQIQENYKYLSYRTLERAYERHILRDKTVSERNAESVNLFCKYLGFEDYADYIKKNPAMKKAEGKKNGSSPSNGEEATRGKKWMKITILIAFGIVLIVIGVQKWPNGRSIEKGLKNQCMAWEDSIYVEVSCTKKPYSKYGTPVETLNQTKLESFKKVEVDMATQFFAEETNKPLIWYCKNTDGEIEYFTAPGLHPITGETLKKITPYIIQTYVSPHIERADSFVQ